MGVFEMDIKAIAILFVCISSTFCASWKSGDDLNPKQDELAILVTGGDGTSISAELISTNGTSICQLPQMSQSKESHSQSGLTACGGMGSGSNPKSCIKFESGSWSTLTDNLVNLRWGHSSWINPDGDILLIGGGVTSKRTSEIVYHNGTSIRSFDLKYDTDLTCTIELPESFIVTGGFQSYKNTKVSRYTTSGWVEDLPKLITGRYSHGCGYYFNDDMERVFLVAGGSGQISSTEVLVEGGHGWSFKEPLPSGRDTLHGISLLDTVILTGGYHNGSNLDDVLMFDTKTTGWNKIGRMQIGRSGHAASLVNLFDIVRYCN